MIRALFFWCFLLFTGVVCYCQGVLPSGRSSMDDSTSIFTVPRTFIPIKSENGIYFRNKDIRDTIIKIHIDKYYPDIGSDHGYFVKSNDKYGVIGFFGDTIVPFDADTIFFGIRNIVTKNEQSYEIINPIKFGEKRSKTKIEADSILLHNGLIYHYKDGKSGVADDSFTIPATYEAITFLRCNNAKFNQNTEAVSTYYFKAITSDGDLQLVNSKNEAILPDGVTEIQCYLFGYIMFYDTHYKYYNIVSNNFIDNNGHDVVIYDRDIYKCYNKERDKSAFFLKDRVFKNTYDDYFYMGNRSQIAVRKNDKVGLMDIASNELVLPLEYEQVKYFDKHLSKHYKTYKNQRCGVTASGGKTLIDHQYADIKSTINDSLFIVINGSSEGGVVSTNNRTVIPLKFPQIRVYEREILVRQGSEFALYSINGKNIVPFRYTNVDTEKVNGSAIFIFYNSSKKLYIANHNGYLGKQPVSHIEFGDGLIKTYSGNVVSVSILNNNGGLEETQTYERLGIFEIEGDQRFYPDRKWTWERDEIEENQLTGLYGRRKLNSFGFSFPPTYNTIRYSKFGSVYGVAHRSRRKTSVFPGLHAANERYFERIDSQREKPLLMCDNAFVQQDVWNRTNSKYLMQDTLGRLYIANETNFDQSKYPADGFVYARNKQFNGKFHWFSKDVEITKGEYDLSLAEYFGWINSLGAYAPSISDLKRIYDPHWGVSFHNSTIMVSQRKIFNNKESNLYFFPPKFYKQCRELNGMNALMYKKEKSNSWNVELFHKLGAEKYELNQPIIKECRNAKIIDKGIVDLLLVTTNDYEQFKVHRDFPEFHFRPDSFFVSYDNGFLTLRIEDSNYVLMQPDQSIIYDCLEKIEHLTGNYFLIKEIGEGSSVLVNAANRDTIFENVIRARSFNEKLFLIEKQRENSHIRILLDSDLNEIKTFNHVVRPFKGNYIWKDYNKKVVLNLKSGKEDTLNYASYDLFENGFITYEVKARSYIRRFGSSDSISIRDGIKFEPFGNYLYGIYGDRHLRIDSKLEEVNFSRRTEIQIIKDRFLIKNDGRTVIVEDKQENELFSSEDVEIEFSVAPNYISFYEAEELKYITMDGRLTSDYKEVIMQIRNGKKYRITKPDREYGLMIDYDQVLENKYGSITILNDDEFTVESNGHQKVYDEELQFTGITGQKIYPLLDFGEYLIQNGSFIYTITQNGILLDRSEYWNSSWGVPNGR